MAKRRSLVGRLLGGTERDYNYKLGTKAKMVARKVSKPILGKGITKAIFGGK